MDGYWIICSILHNVHNTYFWKCWPHIVSADLYIFFFRFHFFFWKWMNLKRNNLFSEILNAILILSRGSFSMEIVLPVCCGVTKNVTCKILQNAIHFRQVSVKWPQNQIEKLVKSAEESFTFVLMKNRN